MLKLTSVLLFLIGTCAAQNDNPIDQLQGTARVLMVFSPDANSANFKRQLELIEHHNYELTERNTVVIPVALGSGGDAPRFPGENVALGTSTEQADVRTRYHVQPSQFVVVLLNRDGTEQIRYVAPVGIHDLVASLDAMPKH